MRLSNCDQINGFLGRICPPKTGLTILGGTVGPVFHLDATLGGVESYAGCLLVCWGTFMREANSIVCSVPIPAFVFHRETRRFLAANALFVDLLGYTENELLEMFIDQIRPPEDLPLLEKAVQSDPPQGATEWRYIRKDGTLLYVRIRYRNNELVENGKRYRVRFVVVESWDECPIKSAREMFS